MSEWLKELFIDEAKAAVHHHNYADFFSVYQNNGNQRKYEYAFAGPCWTNNSYHPSSDIVGDIASAFRGSFMKDTLVPIKVIGRTANAFTASMITTIPSIDLTYATNTAHCFSNASNIENVTFVGKIPSDINLQACTNLKAASIISAIEALDTSKKNCTLTLSTDHWDRLAETYPVPDGYKSWQQYVTEGCGWGT